MQARADLAGAGLKEAAERAEADPVAAAAAAEVARRDDVAAVVDVEREVEPERRLGSGSSQGFR